MTNLTNNSADSEVLSAKTLPESQTAGAQIPPVANLVFSRQDRNLDAAPHASNSTDGLAILDIFRKPDLSTLLFGASRYFLQTMQDMAAHDILIVTEDFAHLENWWRENARAIAADAARAASGVKITAKDVLAALDRGTTGSAAKDAAIDTDMQSRFAHAAETYLIEGIAPSPEMRGVFEQFRDWLLSIYRRLVALDISLAPDVAAIFFRMLASDIAIEMAQQDVGGEAPVFADAQAACLTQPHYDRLLKLRALASQEAKARLLRQMMEPVRREGQKAYKAEKAAVRREVEKEIDATSLYRAIEWMANRRWLDEETPPPSGDIRFDKAALVARYGAGILEALPRSKHFLHADHGGLDPDIVADLFGLGSGDELVAAMALAPAREDAIAFEVERVMLQRHGDMLIDGSAEERAIAAVHNDRRAEWLAAELAALIEVAGSGDGLTAVEARAYALSATAGMEVADAMDGARFLAAGRRTAIEAIRLGDELAQDETWRERASRKAAGNADAAAHGQDERIARLITAKRRQLLNHAIYAESLDIIGEVEKFEAEAESLASGPTREKLAAAVLRDNGRIDYPGAIDALLDRFGLGGRADRQTGVQAGGQDDPRIALRNYSLAMKAAGRENELAIPDSVLIGSGRQSYKEITLERFRAVAAALKNLEHAARRAGKLIDADREADIEATVASLVGALRRPRPAGPAKGERPPLDPARAADALLLELDATAAGPAHRAIKAPLDAAASRLALRKQKAAADLEELYNVYSGEERYQMATSRYLPALGQSLSKWEAIAIALNTGNEVNRRRLTDGRIQGALDEAGLAAVLASLDARDAGFVQSVWDYLAALEPDIAAREKRVTGIAPQWVQPVSVEIAGKALKGGYYPLAYDAADAAPDPAQALGAGRFAKSATEAGHGRSRVDLAARPLDLDIAVLHRHVNHLIYDLEFSEPLANARRLLDDAGLKTAFEEAGRAADLEALKAWLSEMGAGELRSADRIGRMARLAKKNVTAVSLANDLAASLSSRCQLAGIIAASGRGDFVAALQNAFRPGIIGEVASRSPLMASRGFFAEAGTAWETMAGWLEGTLRHHLIERPAWLAFYNNGIGQFGGDEAKALAHADARMRQAIVDPFPAHAGSNETLLLFKALGAHLAAKFKAGAEATGQDADTAARQGIALAMDLTALAMTDMVFTAAIGGHDNGPAWPAFLAQHTGYSVMAALPAIRDAEKPLAGTESDARALVKAIRPPSGDIGIGHQHVTEILEATGLAAESPADEIPRKVDAGFARIGQP
ncbi:hypothetical protein [Rhizobium sp. WYJ-E13]|uniref:hypothetical protein n=1 Tax=Rhizobium sp. WYJ-E13 TaxID=2849093 RepID=UPI001C1F0947|nr:hypothetical protein [Rhizobium sp. WYJ-E13]QWW70169.1 hypothetical protein KQ933_10935 [Rhizobium sp. WYJ-E13]